jgi:hypothetical protein
MSDSVREQVLGYLLGALEDAEMEQVQARLESDRAYRREFAGLRGVVAEIEAAGEEYEPPAGLAERTCALVFAQGKPSPRRVPRGPAISPQRAPPSWCGRARWLDATVAAAVFLIAAALTLPAIQSSRFHARLTACRDNLRELGVALAGYSRANHDYFPRVPAEGKLASAGIYAPTLLHDGFLTEARRVCCPDSPLADAGGTRVPTLAELQAAGAEQAARLRQQMGGSYGYCLGYLDHGVLCATKNLNRADFALLADAPREERADRQSANHGGSGQNVLFEDGHVEFLATSRPAGRIDDIFANDDNLVAAGMHRDDSVIASSGVAPIVFVRQR